MSWESDRTTVAEAEIRLTFERCDAGRPRHGIVSSADFCGFYNAREQRISLTGRRLESGAVYLPEDLRGLHLGSFAMSEIVRWAKQWPEAIVEPISLVKGDADPENGERRNRFYEQFGLCFDYESARREAGRSQPIRTGDLIDSEGWKGFVHERPLLDAIAEQMQRGDDMTRDLRARNGAVANLAAQLRWADDHPIRACLRRLWARHPYAPFVAVIVALFVWGIRRSM